MGLFSSSRKTYVSSTIYNLAGELEDRTSYLKSITITSILSNSRYLADSIQRGLTLGPNSNQTAFFKWAKNNYPQAMPVANVSGDSIVNAQVIAPYIPKAENESVWVQSALMDSADYNYWVEKYLAEYHPEVLEEEYTSDINDNTNVVTIQTATNTYTFIAADLDKTAKYVMAKYVTVMNSDEGIIIPGELIEGLSNSSLVPKNGYNEVSHNENTGLILSTPETIRTIREYTDGTPREDTTVNNTVNLGYSTKQTVYDKTEFRGFYPGTGQTYSERKILRVWESVRAVRRTERTENTLVNGREIIVRTYSTLVPLFSYRIDTQNIIQAEYSRPKVFIYKIGNGNAVLDALSIPKANLYEFFPVIPVRIDNKFITEEEYDDVFPIVKKAYKKAFGSKIESFIEQLEDNESLKDIDFAYLMFGVTVNEKDKSAKKYMYEFFKMLMTYQETTKSEFEEWLEYERDNAALINAWNDWKNYKVPAGGTEPERPTLSPAATSTFTLNAPHPKFKHYNLQYKWNYIHETVNAGVGKAGAKPGDVWIEVGEMHPDLIRNNTSYGGDSAPRVRDLGREARYGLYTKVFIYHQLPNLKYRRLEILGMSFENYVYNKKTVYSTLAHAVNEVGESEFVVPIHYPTLSKLSLIEKNQLATVDRLCVFNSYKVVKRRWYQRGIFKLIMVIVIAAVSVMLNPVVAAQTIGIFGSNAAVASSLGALGLTGTTALITAAVANSLAAMVLTTLVTRVSTQLFEGKWGALINSIISFVAMTYTQTFISTGNLAVNWSAMFNPANLLKLTESVGTGIQNFVNGSIQEMMGDLESLKEKYKEHTKKVEDLMAELLGTGKADLDLLAITNSTDAFALESSDSFLQRTLLTGSDITELSIDMIEGFAELSLQLPNAYR